MNVANNRPSWFLLTQHWLSLTGLALLATALISWLFVLPLQLRGHASNPYVGIIAFLILPIGFFAGLILVPIGVYISKHRIREGFAQPAFDRQAALKRIAWFFGITTILNILIGTQLTYRAVSYMDTPQFCGSSCHTMAPQFAAYQNSPHSRVECVECHVAPGAAGWVNSKANGLRQLFQTITATAPKPVPSALASNRLVPARKTCENCHWPQHFGGVRLRVLSNYAEDEQNTRTDTVLLMMVGGNRFPGIHGAHFGPGVHIRFAASNPERQTIPWVEYRNSETGAVRTFVSTDSKGASVDALPKFEMQCVDCHNRPSHTFELPERAMNRALALGEISVTLPFVKKQGVELLKKTYATQKEAATQIPLTFASFYQQNYSELSTKRSEDIRQAGKAILAIYNRNVFPELKVSWGTYPNNLGHTDFPGCFRCHDGSHTAGDGQSIAQDCSTCHQPLAIDEPNPEILKTLGISEKIQNLQQQ